MRGSIRSVPDAPPRAALYLRQSISHDDSISLELQETACRAYCETRGYHVQAVEADPGITGRTWKRPAVQRVMELVESGGADVVILWKWSRLSRSRKDWALAADKVEVAGGRIESATEQADVGTASGRLTRGMLVELAAFESDRIGEVWSEVHQSRLARGLVPSARRRWGYAYDTEAKIHRPDPIEGPLLRSAYEQYTSGRGFMAITEWLNTEGARTARGGAFSYETLTNVMDSGFAAGLIKWGGQLHPGAHEPLIDEEMWQQYLDRRDAARRIHPRRKASKFVLSGLVRCARCGAAMSGRATAGQAPQFRCKARSRSKRSDGSHCKGGYVSMRHVEAAVLKDLAAYAAAIDAEAAESERALAVQVSAEGEMRRYAREVSQVDEYLERLTVQLAEGVVPQSAYEPARDKLVARRAAAIERLEAAGRDARASTVDRAAIAAALLSDWDDTDVVVRRTMLGQLIEQVKVTTSSDTTTVGVAGGVSNAVVEVDWKV